VNSGNAEKPSVPSTTPSVAPSTDSVSSGKADKPSVPSVDTVSSGNETKPSTDANKPTEPSVPSVSTTTDKDKKDKADTNKADKADKTDKTDKVDKAEAKPTTPVETPVQPAPPTVSTAEANQNGQSQVGTQSVTGQVVRDVTPSNPVVTDKGYTITNVQNGVATLSSGEQANLVDLGATKNSDRTYTVTNNRGEKETLPETGEVSTGVLTAIGAIVVGFALSLFGKKKTNLK
jgi:LPXTG-motif cell wall-anchored protein